MNENCIGCPRAYIFACAFEVRRDSGLPVSEESALGYLALCNRNSPLIAGEPCEHPELPAMDSFSVAEKAHEVAAGSLR